MDPKHLTPDCINRPVRFIYVPNKAIVPLELIGVIASYNRQNQVFIKRIEANPKKSATAKKLIEVTYQINVRDVQFQSEIIAS